MTLKKTRRFVNCYQKTLSTCVKITKKNQKNYSGNLEKYGDIAWLFFNTYPQGVQRAQ